jgi:hypothetical protein
VFAPARTDDENLHGTLHCGAAPVRSSIPQARALIERGW